ncbi:MBL fold metallo-hydrolase [Isobaculum melis]|uniref:Glyoxylase, beta-lactamase superfamily II n=1 Tax=Isobaculum melis TaxID=142588 RepID=A0A1H9UHY0_9LACT|nr:MBL fold metallo-hydrolase [Isobaculum melis]SES08851.1 Glyoxylase, beta-lactamase superfamily II [Isobaculum melis]
MKDWFTIEEIDSNTFAISEYQHWEQTHCYLLNGETSSLLIDTGLGVANMKEIVASLTKNPIQVVTTHVHWDHIGGHRYFQNIAVHKEEESWLTEKFPVPLAGVKSNLLHKPCDFPVGFDSEQYEIFQGQPSRILADGDMIHLGSRLIKVIHTPGHSPGHLCFYEAETGYLFTGDLVYTGKLDAFYPTTNPVDFMHSIKKIKALHPQKIFPGHFELSPDPAIIEAIDQAFTELATQNKLKQGNGIFKYEQFSLHL